MFTGLIQNLGEVVEIQQSGQQASLFIRIPLFSRLFDLGESVAVNGVCLTVTSAELNMFKAEVSPETLKRTNLSEVRAGSKVNIEFPLLPTTPLGGHFVQGHVDTVASIQNIRQVGDFFEVQIKYPEIYSNLLIEKGSITVDGVSLTINELRDPDVFSVMIIPHTWNQTRFQFYKIGDRVNLEMDLLAKYVQRMVAR